VFYICTNGNGRVFIKSYETHVMIYKINACLGKQLLTELVSNLTVPKNLMNKNVRMSKAIANLEADIVFCSNVLIV
jgi:hypothetical protein